MNEHERLVFLSKDYNRLQTLRFAAISVIFIISPWTILRRADLADALIWSGVYIAACVSWYWLLNGYYKERYGRIKERLDWKSLERRRLANIPFGVFLLVWTYFIIWGRHAPRDFYFLTVPAGMLGEGLSYSDIPLRRFYYIVASMVSLLLLLPALVRGMPGHQFFNMYDSAFLGVVMLMLQIYDHLLLVRSFRESRLVFNA